MATNETMTERVSAGVDAWLRWVPKWTPGTHRGKARLCRRCTGSPVLAAAGITGDTPHQVTHALVSRMHKIIDKRVDEYTASELPTLHAELTGAEIWRAGGFDPSAGLDPEYEGIDPDPEFESDEQPVLFTMAGLAEEVQPDPPLPQPPLSSEEKRRLRVEIDLADRCAAEAGREVCFALVEHQVAIEAAIQRFVEPQVQTMLEDLSKYLEPPQ